MHKIDPVVQLVRMPPCHGGGRGFESRPDRNYNIKVVPNAVKHMFYSIFCFVISIKKVKKIHSGSELFGNLLNILKWVTGNLEKTCSLASFKI